MLSINTNLQSLVAQNSLKISTQKLNQAIERMTTGFKVNHAADNAANYSISTNMTTKINSYMVAEDNVAMGMDMLSTASDSLNLISDQMTRIRDLATQAKNGTYGENSLAAINSEINSRIDEIQRNFETTKFNGIDLFKTSETFIEDVVKRDTSTMDKLSEVDADTGRLESGKTYSISTAADLEKLAKITNEGRLDAGVEFVLDGDINLGGKNWTPIGTETNKFTGKFDGNGYSIQNLNINTTEDNVGLFGMTENVEITNLGIENVGIKGNGYVGALIGQGKGDLTITNSFVTGKVNGEAKFIGGMVGYTDYDCIVSMDKCFTTADVTAKESGTGGLIGLTRDNTTIKNSYTTGAIISDKANAGGFIGQSGSAGKTTTIENCFTSGNVSSGTSNAGGLVGGVNTSSVINISSSYATGNVNTGTNCAGGLVGNGGTSSTINISSSYTTGNVNSGTTCAGGLVGSASFNLKIENSYATGEVKAVSFSAGGLVGQSGGTTNNGNTLIINNSFATGNISTLDKQAGGLVGLAACENSYITNSYATGNVSVATNHAGGLVASVYNLSTLTITSSYATGDVTGKEDIGGLVGSGASNSNINISSSYTTGNIKGEVEIGGLVGYSQGSLTSENNYILGTISATGIHGAIVGSCRNNSTINVSNNYISSNFAGLNIYDKLNASDVVTANIETPTVTTNTVPFTYNYNYGTELSFTLDSLQRCRENNVNFQVGIFGNESSVINISTSFALKGLDKLRKIGIGDDDYLSLIDNLNKTISAKQTEYGSAMNRLESALDEINTHYENLVSSRSTLRDADISEVSAEYIKMQILQQASSTLLSTANQSPALALQLI